MKEYFKNILYKIWYWYISTVDKNAEVIFMNYGYSKDNHKIKLDKNDEKNRYSAQLYNLVATGINIKGKDILEVGCGRGGGLSYINQNLSPRLATGIDLNSKAIKFCNKHYSENNATFFQANAQELPFENETFNAVLNVESSHRYPQAELFFNEVYRVLKPGGYFLIADFRYSYNIEKLEIQLKNSKLQIEKKQNITANVLEALELATPDRELLIKKIVPGFLQDLARNFAATTGSATYNKFLTGKFIYKYYILKK